MGALLAVPTLSFAGGYSHTNWKSATTTTTPAAVTTTTTSNTYFGSSEDPANAIQARSVTGSENDNYARYNYGFIPNSYWVETLGADVADVNGTLELEEYLGETRRESFAEGGEDLDREDERQDRAKNKALRLRAIMGR